jgi:hypothetical protein
VAASDHEEPADVVEHDGTDAVLPERHPDSIGRAGVALTQPAATVTVGAMTSPCETPA